MTGAGGFNTVQVVRDTYSVLYYLINEIQLICVDYDIVVPSSILTNALPIFQFLTEKIFA